MAAIDKIIIPYTFCIFTFKMRRFSDVSQESNICMASVLLSIGNDLQIFTCNTLALILGSAFYFFLIISSCKDYLIASLFYVPS